jgi:hypothetical protein
MELSKFYIPTFRKADIQIRLDKLARKAAKYGNGDISYSFGPTELRKVETEYGSREYEFIEITVSGEAPQIAGWQLLARVELLGKENLIHYVPGTPETPSKEYRTHNGHCDHCNSLRRRNDVYVLTDGAKQIAVGRSCLRDFLGIDDPKSIVNRAQFFEELRHIQDEDMLSSFGSFGYFDLNSVLVLSAAYIRKVGYVSKAKQADTGYETTGQCIVQTLRGSVGYEIDTIDADTEVATKTLNYFRFSPAFDNQYMENIRVLMKQDLVKREHVALIASSIIAAERVLAPKEETKESNFVGVEKERLKGLDLALEKVIFLGHGSFGPSYLHLMKDACGNVFSWITGNKVEVAEGSNIKLDATVKQHKLYNGTKQTVLTRAKLKEC